MGTSAETESPASLTRLLVVEDDAAVRRIYMEVLGGPGREVLAAGSCAEAFEHLDRVAGQADVFVVDLGLPDGDGAEFVRNAVKKYGARPTLFISGWTDEFWDLHDAPGRWLVMRKPIPIAKLKAAVHWLAAGGEKPAELAEPG
jgi:two-component system KDP operon response regulator KdpE